MSKTVRNVFLVIGTLVLCFVVWMLFFSNNGILRTAYNTVATQINNGYKNLTGGTTNVVPTWGTPTGAADTEGNGNADTLGSGATSK